MHSLYLKESSFVWEILWTEEPGSLQSTRSKELDTPECTLKIINASRPRGLSTLGPSWPFTPGQRGRMPSPLVDEEQIR